MLKKIERYLNHFPGKKQLSDINPRSYASLVSFVDLMISWEDIVGARLVDVSLPQRVYKKSLYIVTNHPSYAQHLKLLQDDILEKIFKFSPNLQKEFNNLKFFYSEKVFKEQKEKRDHESEKKVQTAKPLDEKINFHDPKVKPILEKAREIYKDVDPEFRDSFISLYVQHTLNRFNT